MKLYVYLYNNNINYFKKIFKKQIIKYPSQTWEIHSPNRTG